MQRIILSVSLIVLVAGTLAFGATNAFFSDTEISSTNTFAAGAIDLRVDNDSYYNGVFNPDTSWGSPDPVNLDEDTFLFFDFDDVKPDDYGEDTISLHVDTNDAYLCANVTLTSNDDNTQTEPEALVDLDGLESGELAELVNFIWWADDGDNVLETDETVINTGNFAGLGVGNSYAIALADSDENIWTDVGGPVPGGETQYIGKAWCFGDIAEAALPQDDYASPIDDNDESGTAGEPEDGGYTCDGTGLGNESQTDSLTADISFSAVQARHNGDFQCEAITRPTTITIVKTVSGGDAVAGDFSFEIDNAAAVLGSNVVTAGIHTVAEVGGPTNYTPTFGDACDANGNITAIAGQNVTCTILNTYEPPVAGPETILTENFGTGDCLKDIAGWEEDTGDACPNGTVAKDPQVSGDDTVSPDGGRFALLSGNNGYICREINAAGYEDMVLKYYWRGDSGAKEDDFVSVRYFTTGTCAAPGSMTTLATHELDDGNNNVAEPWSALQSINLPNMLDNTTFFIRFMVDANAGNASFRLDGITIDGTPI